MKVLAISGSPRKRGNSTTLMKEFLRGAEESGADIQLYSMDQLNIKPCKGCLKCSIHRECVIKDDDWPELAAGLMEAQTILFASPVYFHHLPGPMKTILDRFRSFISVKVREDGLDHTPWQSWNKRFVLLLTLGSPLTEDAQPIIDLFQFMIEVLGPENKLDVLTATCLQMSRQIEMNEFRLKELYNHMDFPEEALQRDLKRHKEWLEKAYQMGKNHRLQSEETFH